MRETRGGRRARPGPGRSGDGGRGQHSAATMTRPGSRASLVDMAMRAGASGSLRVIRTKVLPPVRRRLVPRPGLIEPLRPDGTPKLTLICAPAGFGKTSLLTAWAETGWEDRPFAWFAIDEADDDPKLFWAYVIESLRAIDAAIGVRSTEMLQAPGPLLLDLVILELINEIAATGRRMVLALDDYHVITDPEIH